MSRPRIAFSIVLGSAILLVACATGTTNVPATKLLDLINQKRAEAGCPPVAGNDKLRVAAERHVLDMLNNKAHLQTGTDGHTGTDGSRPQNRIADAGYAASATGEIIYWSDVPSDEVKNVDWWMNSPDHKKIMLNCSYKNAGVGLLYPGGTKWYSVVVFASPL
jgi:uncharacterized protein YkwD